MRRATVSGARSSLARFQVAIALAAWTVPATLAPSLLAQGPPSPTIPCPPSGAELVNPPEIRAAGGILRGTIYLVNEQQRLPRSENGNATCQAQLVRNFRSEAPLEPVDRNDVRDPMPGPTLRARVGDLVQLAFVNQIDSALFERGLDVDECTRAKWDGGAYPEDFGDAYPNCLHASSTANIHFHGTHTNPDATGDNVYLQIRPLPRDNRGNLTTTAAQATADFPRFFAECAKQLRPAPLTSWPSTWADTASTWTDLQTELLKAHQQRNPTQPLWDEDQAALVAGGWPVSYIGAFPYCFGLPDYPGPAGSRPPVMGQLPGTHWYHAHKHGSTAMNVMNGMTGAFIIEGKYDDDLNAAYGDYVLSRGRWNTRAQKVLVLNQLGTDLNALNGATPPAATPRAGGLDFAVNGRLAPKVTMQPGEIQLWRIINTSARTAAFFMPPAGLEWRQIAQDGVQYDDENYRRSLNRPFYMAPANRVDLLVKAPMTPPPSPIEVRIQNVMALAKVAVSNLGRILLTVQVSGPAVRKDGQPAEMSFLEKMLPPPCFLNDITDEELELGGSIRRTLVFSSQRGPSAAGQQHTINGIQFDDRSGRANLAVVLGAVEEWKIVNTTNFGNDRPNNSIDHPLHIHINPFQVTEMFDPNERLIDWATRKERPRYVFKASEKEVDEQCVLDPDTKDESTWKPCEGTRQGHWWDVFRIPTARIVPSATGPRTVPGYFKMRSRFVDYPGRYVMHCHILIHEDRGMMYSVEVVRPAANRPPHH